MPAANSQHLFALRQEKFTSIYFTNAPSTPSNCLRLSFSDSMRCSSTFGCFLSSFNRRSELSYYLILFERASSLWFLSCSKFNLHISRSSLTDSGSLFDFSCSTTRSISLSFFSTDEVSRFIISLA